eukprot:355524-Chlamydomonas_euryale.AAC.22
MKLTGRRRVPMYEDELGSCSTQGQALMLAMLPRCSCKVSSTQLLATDLVAAAAACQAAARGIQCDTISYMYGLIQPADSADQPHCA